MNSRTSKSVTTKVAPFAFKLPPELDVKPKWSVPVSARVVAEVYETKKATHSGGSVDGYLLVAVKDGKVDKYGEAFVTDLLGASLILRKWAIDFAPKVKTTRESED